MKRIVLGLFLILLCSGTIHASLILHVQSPMRGDGNEYTIHVLGAANSQYTATFTESSLSMMVDEGNDWYSYTWDKNVSDFQDWVTFNISICNGTTCEKWGMLGDVSYEFKMATFFATDTEVWLYTNTVDRSYTKQFIAPNSKVIWFKSPWGNKALPQMIFGTDSVLMRYSNDDPTKCGWFYGAITPKMLQNNAIQTVYFQRFNSPHFSFPEKGKDEIDLSLFLSVLDSIYINSDDLIPTPTEFIGPLGDCFDSSRVLHIYHPWRNNTSYRDSLIYISVGNNILSNPTATNRDTNYKYWFNYEFPTTITSSASWASSSALFNIYRKQNEWPQVKYFADSLMPLMSEIFPLGVYEVWFFTNSNGTMDLSFSPLEPKVVRLKSPWDDKSPSMIVNSDTIKMGPLKDTCGWYQAIYYKHIDSWDVLFKQSFGMEIYGAEGTNSLLPIGLDSVMSILDTIWIRPYPVSNSAPVLDLNYPGVLGICPKMKISAMLIDWAGESYADSIDIDFGGIYGGNAYTTVLWDGQERKTCSGTARGMVQDTLSSLGLPLRVDSLDFPWDTCSAGREVDNWFIPEVVATDASGKEFSNATCRDIDLALDDEGFWLADITDENGCIGGFYPLDDFEYLDSAKTIKNPKFDWNISGCMHNYSFSMKITAEFQYIKGQYFEFRGDDDVWVFINDRLVVDIGGCHSPVEGAVNLDTIGQNDPSLKLVEGQTYPFHIFFSERNATGSNFKMRTSINLQTQKTYYPMQEKTADGTIKYNIKQLLMEENVSCNVSSVSKIDTIDAQSVFVLSGGSLDPAGVSLNPGINYGGIEIAENMSGFIIDTNAIVIKRALQPGTYVLQFYLASDMTQSSEVYFTVPAYPLPTIAFVDSVGNRLDSNATIIGNLAFVPYEVRIVVLYMDSIVCTDCFSQIRLETLDSLSFLDANEMPITSIDIDSTGYASFYVMGLKTIVNGSLKISGTSVANVLTLPINMEEPPVPYPKSGEMYDRNGDGVPDSLILIYSSPLENDDIPDSLSWLYGDTIWHNLGESELLSLIKDSSVIIKDDSLMDFVFTGLEGSIYKGSSKTRFSYIATDGADSGKVQEMHVNGIISDKIGPIITNAFITPKAENVSLLSLTFSESIDESTITMDSILEFKVWREGVEVSGSLDIRSETRLQNGKRYDIYFMQENNAVLPTVGDSVRFAPGVARDLEQNYPHINNPFVRIIGEQFTTVDETQLIIIDSETKQWDSLSPVVAQTFPLTETFKNAEKEMGIPGHLIRYDLSELLLTYSDVSKDDIFIEYEVFYFTNLGVFVNSHQGKIRCSDSIFNGDCSKNPGNIYLGWNAKSENGRLVGTGAYLSRLKFKIKAGTNLVDKKDKTTSFGIKRNK